MRFAVIGDIHGNIYALERVLADIESREVDFILSTGDLVGYMPFPNEVIERIRQKGILVVKGNHDSIIGEGKRPLNEEMDAMSDEEIQKSASKAFTNWVITKKNRSYLKNLPNSLTIQARGLKILLVHGSPRAIDEYLYQDIEKLREVSEAVDEEVIICGHTHIAYHEKVQHKHFINAGSAGKSKQGTPQAVYSIVTIENPKVESEIIEVTYDIEAMIKAIKANRMISDDLITMLQKGV